MVARSIAQGIPKPSFVERRSRPDAPRESRCQACPRPSDSVHSASLLTSRSRGLALGCRSLPIGHKSARQIASGKATNPAISRPDVAHQLRCREAVLHVSQSHQTNATISPTTPTATDTLTQKPRDSGHRQRARTLRTRSRKLCFLDASFFGIIGLAAVASAWTVSGKTTSSKSPICRYDPRPSLRGPWPILNRMKNNIPTPPKRSAGDHHWLGGRAENAYPTLRKNDKNTTHQRTVE